MSDPASFEHEKTTLDSWWGYILGDGGLKPETKEIHVLVPEQAGNDAPSGRSNSIRRMVSRVRSRKRKNNSNAKPHSEHFDFPSIDSSGDNSDESSETVEQMIISSKEKEKPTNQRRRIRRREGYNGEERPQTELDEKKDQERFPGPNMIASLFIDTPLFNSKKEDAEEVRYAEPGRKTLSTDAGEDKKEKSSRRFKSIRKPDKQAESNSKIDTDERQEDLVPDSWAFFIGASRNDDKEEAGDMNRPSTGNKKTDASGKFNRFGKALPDQNAKQGSEPECDEELREEGGHELSGMVASLLTGASFFNIDTEEVDGIPEPGREKEFALEDKKRESSRRPMHLRATWISRSEASEHQSEIDPPQTCESGSDVGTKRGRKNSMGGFKSFRSNLAGRNMQHVQPKQKPKKTSSTISYNKDNTNETGHAEPGSRMESESLGRFKSLRNVWPGRNSSRPRAESRSDEKTRQDGVPRSKMIASLLAGMVACARKNEDPVTGEKKLSTRAASQSESSGRFQNLFRSFACRSGASTSGLDVTKGQDTSPDPKMIDSSYSSPSPSSNKKAGADETRGHQLGRESDPCDRIKSLRKALPGQRAMHRAQPESDERKGEMAELRKKLQTTRTTAISEPSMIEGQHRSLDEPSRSGAALKSERTPSINIAPKEHTLFHNLIPTSPDGSPFSFAKLLWDMSSDGYLNCDSSGVATNATGEADSPTRIKGTTADCLSRKTEVHTHFFQQTGDEPIADDGASEDVANPLASMPHLRPTDSNLKPFLKDLSMKRTIAGDVAPVAIEMEDSESTSRFTQLLFVDFSSDDPKEPEQQSVAATEESTPEKDAGSLTNSQEVSHGSLLNEVSDEEAMFMDELWDDDSLSQSDCAPYFFRRLNTRGGGADPGTSERDDSRESRDDTLSSAAWDPTLEHGKEEEPHVRQQPIKASSLAVLRARSGDTTIRRARLPATIE